MLLGGNETTTMNDAPEKTEFLQDHIECDEGSLFGWATRRIGRLEGSLDGIESEAENAVDLSRD